jgi:hypothetical protein
MKMKKVTVANREALRQAGDAFVAANPNGRVEYQNKKARCFSKTERIEYSYGR